jgi:D-aminoacyl-tRNA deacylase
LIGIVYSVVDPAGRGVARILAERGFSKSECGGVECWSRPGVVLAGFREDVIEFDFLDNLLHEAEYYVVLSRHSSQAGVKSYTVHHTGNFGREALYGGKPGELGIANPRVAFTLLKELVRQAESEGRLGEFKVSYEATHHGPTSLSKPITFIEIGSSMSEWVDDVNHRIVAESVLHLINEGVSDCRPAIGVGGGHYPWKLTEYALRENVCFGHIIPKYSLDLLNHGILRQMVERTYGGVESIVVEKKGTRIEHREAIEEFARETGLSVRYI